MATIAVTTEKQFPSLDVEFCRLRRTLSTMHSHYSSACSHEVKVLHAVLVDYKEYHFLDDAMTFNSSLDS